MHQISFTFVVSECVRGFFRNSTNNVCELCAVGSYSDTNNADSCTFCSDDETTSQEGSTSSSQCGKMSSVILIK